MPEPQDFDTGPLEQSFAVSDYFTPSGYMGDGMFFGQLNGTTNQGCKPRPDHAKGNCYVFTYYPKKGKDAQGWAGVYWVFPANNWGSESGRAVDVSRFQQIRFYAAVEGPAPFTMDGKISHLSTFAGRINPGGQFDNEGAKTLNGVHDHVDGVDVTGGPEIPTQIGPELQQFRLSLDDFARSANCSNTKVRCINGFVGELIGAFGWSLPYPNDGDPEGTTPVKVYLDDIVWDTEAPPPS